MASDPEARNAYLVLADCYLQTGQDKEVVALLKPREALFGSDLAYAYLLGTALLRTGDAAEGQNYVDRVFGAGESAEAHLLMGIAHLGQHDYPGREDGAPARRAAQSAAPDRALAVRADAAALGEQDAAERAFRKELELNVNDFEANLQLGNLRKDAQKFAEASTYLERATTVRPTDLTARKLLATLRLQTGQVDEAVRMLESIVEEAPDVVEVHVQLATAYNRLKRKDDAQPGARHRRSVERRSAGEAARRQGARPMKSG